MSEQNFGQGDPGERLEDSGARDELDAVETVGVRRFAETLERVAAGERVDLDPTEDPELSRLVQTSAAVTRVFASATETQRFRSYRQRSRAAILSTLRPKGRGAFDEPVSLWRRRWLQFAMPAASAAAAAILTLAFVLATDGGSTGPESAASLEGENTGLVASMSIVDRLETITRALNELERRNNDGELVSAEFLRALTENQATVAADIASAQPGSLPDGIATTAFQTTVASGLALEGARTDPNAIGALEAARQQSEHARIVTAKYLTDTQFTITANRPRDVQTPEHGDEPIEIEGGNRS